MYELIATAAAGIGAGVGLHAALAGNPSSDSRSSTAYHHRTRVLNILLASISAGAAVATHYEEGQGNLWLAAASVSGLSVPYHLLLMTPPKSFLVNNSNSSDVLSPGGGLGNGHAMRARRPIPQEPTFDTGENRDMASQRRINFADDAGLGMDEIQGAGMPEVRSRLMHVKSGVLVSPQAYQASWTKKYWFSAALSCGAFAAMMSILASRRDNAARAPPF